MPVGILYIQIYDYFFNYTSYLKKFLYNYHFKFIIRGFVTGGHRLKSTAYKTFYLYSVVAVTQKYP
ncbi:hypothetical protein GGR35_000336 [Mucilaginibacter phyllosphaerae]|uniref:Uncharacterized protein n=1 Tax=Mucilaginibacter phyllosphaerae TaxID=1812349 RepID=A0ABR6I3Y9_9SPHI|nr:hypothetical protein [Mucilaginibacter phyllosphaerae]